MLILDGVLSVTAKLMLLLFQVGLCICTARIQGLCHLSSSARPPVLTGSNWNSDNWVGIGCQLVPAPS